MKRLLFILKIMVTLAVLYFALRNVTIDEYKNAISVLRPQVFLFLIFTVVLQVVILAYRWFYLMFHTAKVKMSHSDSIVGTLMSFFFSQGLPASLGADAFRVWWSVKRGVSSRSAIQIVFFDRIYGLIALTIACFGSVLYFFMLKKKFTSQVISLGLVIGIVSIILFLCVMPFRLGFSQYMVKISQRFPLWISKIIAWGGQVRATLSQHNGSQSFVLIGSSFLTHCMVILQAYAVGHLLCPEKISLLICILAVPPALMISYMPFSIAGWGVREASMVMSFGLFGISAATAVIISITIGLVVLVTSLLGGAFWIIGYRKRHEQDIKLTEEGAS